MLVKRQLTVGRIDDLLMHVDNVPEAAHDPRALMERVVPRCVDDRVHRIDIRQLVGRAAADAAADDEESDPGVALGLTQQPEHHLTMRGELLRQRTEPAVSVGVHVRIVVSLASLWWRIHFASA